MINAKDFEELKDIYLELSEVIGKVPIDQSDLLIDYSDKQDALLERDFECLKDAKELLKKPDWKMIKLRHRQHWFTSECMQ